MDYCRAKRRNICSQGLKGRSFFGLPKKPKCGFMFFALQRRAMLKDELPGLSVADCSKVIGGEWRDLSEGERAPFEEMAARDRERYNGEKMTWGGDGVAMD